MELWCHIGELTKRSHACPATNSQQYAMLAGYLPFDDDPANPEGDNINLLYKYIVTTPLTFPEYVTPHARDLLRRILVPDPRKRADLFEVARHSWLSEYAHVVSFITSTTTTNADIAPQVSATGEILSNTRTTTSLLIDCPEDQVEAPNLARSASVREPVKHQTMTGTAGGRNVSNPVDTEEKNRTQRDAKRRTVQVEYVAPQSQTIRGDAGPPGIPSSAQANASQARTRARADSTGRPVEVSAGQVAPPKTHPRPTTQDMPPPTRPVREPPRSVSDSSGFVVQPTSPSARRPSTRGSMTGTPRLPSRGNSYGQPVAATVAPTNAEGRFSQPAKSGYIISAPMAPDAPGRDSTTGRPVSQQFPNDYQRPSTGMPERSRHKRNSTVESITKIFGRSNSGRRQSQQPEANSGRPEKKNRMYPPVSMKGSMPNDPDAGMPRPSTDSRRSSFGFMRKENDDKRSSKRFSFLPQAFSRMSLSSKDEYAVENKRSSMQAPPRSRHDSKAPPTGMAFGQGRSRSPSEDTTGSTINPLYDSTLDGRRRQPAQPQSMQRGATAPDLLNYTSQPQKYNQEPQQFADYRPVSSGPPGRFYSPTQSQHSQATDSSLHPQYQDRPAYPPGLNNYGQPPSRHSQAGIQKNNRKFNEAYDAGGNSGSSGGARRVMDWFRKRGRERTG